MPTCCIWATRQPGVNTALTPLENLAWYQALNGERGNHAERLAALGEIGLSGFEDIPAAQLSAGQQRRVALARLVLMPRPLWVLDEPFTAINRQGVDALERRIQGFQGFFVQKGQKRCQRPSFTGCSDILLLQGS